MGTPEPRSIRIGTAEREQAVKALGDHFAQGRLEPHEFEERMTAAYQARTADDLDRLFDDLPRAGAPHHPPGPFPSGRYPVAQNPTSQYPLTGPHPGPPHPAHRAGTSGFPVPYGPGHHLGVPGGHDPQAPYGRHPVTGVPYSDKSRVVAGLLQLILPFGVGRFYTGHAAIGVAQLLLTPIFFIGVLWAFIDGIIILAGGSTDSHGRPLRP